MSALEFENEALTGDIQIIKQVIHLHTLQRILEQEKESIYPILEDHSLWLKVANS